ncbi:MAG: QueT transporter family protein [Ruminococcus sp.]|nr:QueT transporter family protein [Ruminococcus sp.]
MRETKKTTRSQWLVNAAMIAALYVVLTFAQNTLLPGTASMPVQFRVAEVVTIFALYTSAAIPGLTVGCIIANLSSIAALGAYDLIFGSLASLCAALAMYALRKVRWLRLPIAAALMPALMNGIFVGFELDFFFINAWRFDFFDFLLQGGLVALGELGVLFVLGLPLSVLMEKRFGRFLKLAG